MNDAGWGMDDELSPSMGEFMFLVCFMHCLAHAVSLQLLQLLH